MPKILQEELALGVCVGNYAHTTTLNISSIFVKLTELEIFFVFSEVA